MGKRLYALICLLLLVMFSSGCQTAEQPIKTEENIWISNLKTPEMKLSKEEKEFMDGVCKALHTAVLYSDNMLYATNVSGHELDLTLYCAKYDQEGNLADYSWLYADKWEKDQNLRIKLSESLQEVETISLLASYSMNGIMYETNPIPVQLSDKMLDSNLSLKYEEELPCRISLVQDSKYTADYTLISYQLEHLYDTTYILTLTMRKEKGAANAEDICNVRILDENGVVHSSGTTSPFYTQRGEMIRERVYVTLGSDGNYTMQIY